MRIRSASTEDVEAIGRLYDAAWRQVYVGHVPDHFIRAALAENNSPDSIRRRILRPERTDGWLVLEDEDGTVAGGGDSMLTAPGEGQITGLCVEPTWRRRGIGAALLAALTERQRGQGVREQWVGVHWSSPEELPFYRAHGFAVLPEGQPLGEVAAVGAEGRAEVDFHLVMVVRRTIPA